MSILNKQLNEKRQAQLTGRIALLDNEQRVIAELELQARFAPRTMEPPIFRLGSATSKATQYTLLKYRDELGLELIPGRRRSSIPENQPYRGNVLKLAA